MQAGCERRRLCLATRYLPILVLLYDFVGFGALSSSFVREICLAAVAAFLLIQFDMLLASFLALASSGLARLRPRSVRLFVIRWSLVIVMVLDWFVFA